MRIAFLALFLPAFLGAASKDPASNIDELFETSTAKAVVSAPDSLEICLLLPASGSWESPPRSYADYWEGVARSVPEGKKKELISALLDDATYKWAKVIISADEVLISKKGCVPIYHVRVKARKGPDTVDVNFCYYCSDVLAVFNGVPTNSAGLGPGSEGLLVIFRAVFPEDEILSKAHDQLAGRKKPNQAPEPMPPKRHGSP